VQISSVLIVSKLHKPTAAIFPSFAGHVNAATPSNSPCLNNHSSATIKIKQIIIKLPVSAIGVLILRWV